MEAHAASSLPREGQIQDQPQAFGEQPATGIRVVGVVAHRGRLETATHHVGDVDLADDVVVTLGVERMDDERSAVTRLHPELPLEIFGIDRVPPGQPLTRALNGKPVRRNVLHANRSDPDAIAPDMQGNRLRGQPCLAERCVRALPEPQYPCADPLGRPVSYTHLTLPTILR